jgi:signal transduction histidine kinase
MQPDILQAVAATTARRLNEDFLAAMVRALRDTLRVSLALVTQGVGRPITRARPLYFWRAGFGSEIVEYDLSETPCARVYQGEEVIVPGDLCQRYPRDFPFLGYVGVPLRDFAGQTFGHLSVFSEQPIEEPETCARVLRIFAWRAEAELLHREADAERERLIAALTRVNARLDRQALYAKRANAVKSQLLGMAAHDLRGPIGAMISRAETAEAYIERADAGSLAPAKNCCEEAINAAERMEGMIRRLLDAARQDSEDLPYAPRAMDLAQCARMALALNAEAARAKRIVCELRAPEDGAELEADEDLVLEAVDNLISNAIKYSWPESRVWVAIERQPSAIQLEVRDKGQGLSVEDATRVFGRFQRLSAKPTGGEESTGLGLYIVRAIAERHGGSVTADSAGRGKGARFSLVLPLNPQRPA